MVFGALVFKLSVSFGAEGYVSGLHFCIYTVLRTSSEILPTQINPVGFVTETSFVYCSVRILSSNITRGFFKDYKIGNIHIT